MLEKNQISISQNQTHLLNQIKAMGIIHSLQAVTDAGKPKASDKIKPISRPMRDTRERGNDFKDVEVALTTEALVKAALENAARCNCGANGCQNGCGVGRNAGDAMKAFAKAAFGYHENVTNIIIDKLDDLFSEATGWKKEELAEGLKVFVETRSPAEALEAITQEEPFKETQEVLQQQIDEYEGRVLGLYNNLYPDDQIGLGEGTTLRDNEKIRTKVMMAVNKSLNSKNEEISKLSKSQEGKSTRQFRALELVQEGELARQFKALELAYEMEHKLQVLGEQIKDAISENPNLINEDLLERTRDELRSKINAEIKRRKGMGEADHGFKEAFDIMTENSPFLFTGKLCPKLAPCMAKNACTLGRTLVMEHISPVEIRYTEQAIEAVGNLMGWFDKLFQPPENENGRSVAVVGAGPAGLQAAYDLRKMGFDVTIYEKEPRAGGLIQSGIPHYKYDKARLKPYIEHMENMGVKFEFEHEVTKENIEDIKKHNIKVFEDLYRTEEDHNLGPNEISINLKTGAVVKESFFMTPEIGKISDEEHPEVKDGEINFRISESGHLEYYNENIWTEVPYTKGEVVESRSDGNYQLFTYEPDIGNTYETPVVLAPGSIPSPRPLGAEVLQITDDSLLEKIKSGEDVSIAEMRAVSEQIADGRETTIEQLSDDVVKGFVPAMDALYSKNMEWKDDASFDSEKYDVSKKEGNTVVIGTGYTAADVKALQNRLRMRADNDEPGKNSAVISLDRNAPAADEIHHYKKDQNVNSDTYADKEQKDNFPDDDTKYYTDTKAVFVDDEGNIIGLSTEKREFKEVARAEMGQDKYAMSREAYLEATTPMGEEFLAATTVISATGYEAGKHPLLQDLEISNENGYIEEVKNNRTGEPGFFVAGDEDPNNKEKLVVTGLQSGKNAAASVARTVLDNKIEYIFSNREGWKAERSQPQRHTKDILKTYPLQNGKTMQK